MIDYQKPLQIAMDGLVASGKDTVGSRLAYRLQCFFIESGSIYRSAALYLLKQQINLEAPEDVLDAMRDFEVIVHNEQVDERVLFSLFVNQ